MKKILILFCLSFLFCASCDDNTRKDEVSNKALENLCNGTTAEKFLKKSELLTALYVCSCQQGAKRSDQNACQRTTSVHDFEMLAKACKTLYPKEKPDKCFAWYKGIK